MIKSFLIAIIFVFASICVKAKDKRNSFYISNQAPLIEQPYVELPLGAIKPKGWLLKQLNIMNDGSTGHLDETFSMLKDDNGWLGGKGDSLEATPYWLDGALPLAYLLDDQRLKEKVQKYVDWSLDTQRPSGYFGPITQYERTSGKKVETENQGDDWWPRMVMLKVLQQYYTATGDKRVPPFMTNYFQFQMRNLTDSTTLINRYIEQAANSRCQENIMSVYWLYNITQDKFLLDLADKLYEQTYPWTDWFENRNWVINAAAQQNDDNWMSRHGVNVAMGLKTPAIYYQSQGDPKYLAAMKTGFSDLMLLHGLPNGIFSGDEDLHGNAPTQATELCAIVETMYSLEQAIAITGDNTYMDALERVAFNALPAQTSDDYNMRQYLQMPNQVMATGGDYDFSYCERLSNVIGARTGWYCCLTNMHQGWVKYVSHLWYATPDNGLAALVYGPGKVTAKVGKGTTVSINEETSYPFDNTINLTITLPENDTFPLSFRIPKWCKEANVFLNGVSLRTGKSGQIVRIEREWKNNDKVTLEFLMQIFTSNWGKNSRAIERGPLVYALKIGEKWEKKNDQEKGEYYDISPTTPWNYGIEQKIIKDTKKNGTVIHKSIEGNFYWNQANAPIELQVEARKIPDWILVRGVPYQPVTSRYGFYTGEVGETETVTLIPYGCTKLRISAFPVVK
ncbi:beta-L-arabinofuranosidase domain-containing protein [Sunxiuqinia sp. A32]|uniref:beta-L-arabinofuranosidase domain-containing protein n=1 Tax=Sunxiuqinia sp. A32 TaxID=3461496 RepID=UPI0040451C89